MRWIASLLLLAIAVPARGAGPEPELVSAVKAGKVATVRSLVERKADVNATEVDGTSALHWAVRAGDVASTQLLIGAGARVDAANRYGVTPLSLAARNGRGDLIDLLLKSRASVKTAEATLPEGQTLVMLAARTGSVDAVKRLVAAGSDVNARETRTGTTAVVWAASSNRAEVIRALRRIRRRPERPVESHQLPAHAERRTPFGRGRRRLIRRSDRAAARGLVGRDVRGTRRRVRRGTRAGRGWGESRPHRSGGHVCPHHRHHQRPLGYRVCSHREGRGPEPR